MKPIRCSKCGEQPTISRDPFPLVVQILCPCGAGMSNAAPEIPFTEPDPSLGDIEATAIELWNVANTVPARV
jgi:hypothetical protein